MKTTPIVGQILYRLNVGNAARNCKQLLTPVRVVWAGKKYFTTQSLDSLAGFPTNQYYLENWSEKNDIIANSFLYKSEEECETEKLQHELVKKIEDFVNIRMLRDIDVEDLQSVLNILNKD